MNTGGQLLLISDFEGCLETQGPVKQSRLMCSPEFFEAVKGHLAAHPQNKVAFLGDYFDQGNMVVESINGIMDVYRMDPSRVTIIVGNRDVNKFRLVYEMRKEVPTVGALQWAVWAPFYKDMAENPANSNLKTRLQLIVSKSMGAKYPVEIGRGLTETQAGYLLLKIFSDDAAALYAKDTNVGPVKNNGGRNMGLNTKFQAFVQNARNLYRVAKIVHYDPEFKTLMSHAGGMDSFFFHGPEYYTPIKEKAVAQPIYYDKLESARRDLMVAPATQISTFDEETYNAPLKAVVAEIFGTRLNGPLPPAPASPSGDYCLLQALGLKPDGTNHFVSFIQSCENTGCKGPAAQDSGAMYTNYSEFQDTLVQNGVAVLASGHVPHCAPVPLVYKRSDNGKLLYALNDTSNGYRPASRITGLSTYPLIYVRSGGQSLGVGMLPALAPSDMSSDEFGPMFGEWTLETAPVFDTSKKAVVYSTGALTFPARAETKPPGIYMAAKFVKGMTGGRVRNQNLRAAQMLSMRSNAVAKKSLTSIRSKTTRKSVAKLLKKRTTRRR